MHQKGTVKPQVTRKCLRALSACFGQEMGSPNRKTYTPVKSMGTRNGDNHALWLPDVPIPTAIRSDRLRRAVHVGSARSVNPRPARRTPSRTWRLKQAYIKAASEQLRRKVKQARCGRVALNGEEVGRSHARSYRIVPRAHSPR